MAILGQPATGIACWPSRAVDESAPRTFAKKGMMEVQIFGTKKNADTRKALRFFSERRIKTHFMDLDVRPASHGELQRFAQKFGVQALIDRESKRFAALGLRSGHLTDTRWLEKLTEEPLMLKQPLVRWQNKLTIGDAEAEWKSWLAG